MNNANFSIFNVDQESTSDNLLFRTPSDFSYYIQTTAQQEGQSCTQTILDYCDHRDLEPDDVAKLVNRALKEQLLLEMQAEGVLPKGTELSFE